MSQEKVYYNTLNILQLYMNIHSSIQRIILPFLYLYFSTIPL